MVIFQRNLAINCGISFIFHTYPNAYSDLATIEDKMEWTSDKFWFRVVDVMGYSSAKVGSDPPGCVPMVTSKSPWEMLENGKHSLSLQPPK